MHNSIQSFLQYIRFEKKLSEHTFLAYQNDLNQYTQFLESQFSLSNPLESNHSILRSFSIFLMEQKYSEAAINRKISCLKSFYKFCQRRELINTSPTSKLIRPKMPQRLPKQVEAHKLLDLKEFLRQQSADSSYPTYRDYAMFLTFYICGIRRFELISLQWKHINFSSREIKVTGKGNKERIVPLHSSIIPILEKLQTLAATFSENNTYVFLTDKGEKLYDNFAYRKIKNYLAMITSQTGLGPHSLRHSFATHLLNEGAELNAIKEILGHTSLAATQVYTSASIQRLQQVHNFAHPKS